MVENKQKKNVGCKRIIFETLSLFTVRNMKDFNDQILIILRK